MSTDSIEISFLSFFVLINFFIFLVVTKYSYKIKNGILLDQDFSKPQAFHLSAISRSGGVAGIISLNIFFIIHYLIYSKILYEYIFLSNLMFLIGFLDDIKIKISPLKRLILMILFLFLGKSLLSLIGIDVNSFAVAGAFILFFIALEMILGITLYKDDGEASPITASVFPLAFPLIAGPGSLTTLLSLRAEFSIENIIVAVLLNVVVIYIVLKTSSKIERIIGQNGISIIRKVFGVILLAIAVKLFAANIKALFI